jgi:hypothetical protein
MHRSLLNDVSRIPASTSLALPDGLICSLVDLDRLSTQCMRMQYSLGMVN